MAKRNVKIRKPVNRDVEQITSIVKAVMKKVSPGFRRMVNEYLGNRSDTCLVAEIGGRVVGFILGAVKEYDFGVQKTGWIEVLGVHPRYMGSGIGKQLGKRMISVFKKSGARAVHTSVQWKSGDLLAFFNELGFERSNFITLELPLKKR